MDKAVSITLAPVRVSLSGASARSTALTEGREHRVIADGACYLRQGGSSVSAATTDTYLPANTAMVIRVTAGGNAYVAGITSGGTPTLYITPLCG